MEILVCVKAVPDPSIISLNPDTGQIDRDDLVYVVNPGDMVAVEAAVRLKEESRGGRVTLLSMSPPATEERLRQGLAIGADTAMLLWDKDLDGSDSYTTALILARAISSLQYDLILCGSRAIDTEAGQVGIILAEMLDIPVVPRVVDIELPSESGRLTVASKLGGGNRKKVEVTLPVLLAVEAALNEPRYASLPSLMASLRKDVRRLGLRELGLSLGQVGIGGSKTQVVSQSLPKPRPKRLFTPDSSLSAAERMRLIMSGGVITQKATDLFEGKPEELGSKFIEFLKQVGILQDVRE